MKVDRVALTFEGRQVGFGLIKTVEELQQVAETAFGLQRDSYDIYDSCGKVEGEAVSRVLRMAGNATCLLEVRERPAWQRMRELERRIQMIASGDVSTEAVLVSERLEWQKMRQLEARVEALAAGVEQQIQGKVEHEVAKALQDVRAGTLASDGIAEAMEDVKRLETKVDCALAPLLQSLAIAQMDFQMKLDSVDGMIEQLCNSEDLQRVETKVDGAIAPLLQSLAMAQLDFQTSLDDMNSPAMKVAAKILSLEGAVAELSSFDGASIVAKVDALEERAASMSARLARKEAKAPHAPTACELDLAGGQSPQQTFSSSLNLDLSPLKTKPSPEKFAVRVTSDGRVQLKGQASPGKSGSSCRRRQELGPAEWGEALPAPFARSASSQLRQLERGPGARSAPVLPPVF